MSHTLDPLDAFDGTDRLLAAVALLLDRDQDFDISDLRVVVDDAPDALHDAIMAPCERCGDDDEIREYLSPGIYRTHKRKDLMP